MSYRIPIKVKF